MALSVRPLASVSQNGGDRKSTRLKLQSRGHLVCRLLLEKKKIFTSGPSSNSNPVMKCALNFLRSRLMLFFPKRKRSIITRLPFFFNDTATTEIYTLSLHDALPIRRAWSSRPPPACPPCSRTRCWPSDRKSTRLNSSHVAISYAVFCLKKKKAN